MNDMNFETGLRRSVGRWLADRDGDNDDDRVRFGFGVWDLGLGFEGVIEGRKKAMCQATREMRDQRGFVYVQQMDRSGKKRD
jgi:hypothetical protein